MHLTGSGSGPAGVDSAAPWLHREVTCNALAGATLLERFCKRLHDTRRDCEQGHIVADQLLIMWLLCCVASPTWSAVGPSIRVPAEKLLYTLKSREVSRRASRVEEV